MNDFSSAEKELFSYTDSFYVRSVSAGFYLWKKERATLGLLKACTRDLKRFRVLDVGSSWGSLVPRSCGEWDGRAFLVELDVSEQFLDIASRRSKFKGQKNVCFVRQDIQRHGLSFKDESFDVVVASAVLEHLLDPISVVKDVSRVLKRGGYLIVHLPSPDNLIGRLMRLVDRYVVGGRLSKFAQDHSSEPTLGVVFKEHGALGHVSELPYKEWCRLFGVNGFTVERVERGSGLVGQAPAIDILYPLFALVLLLEPILDYLPCKHLFSHDFMLLLKKG